MAALQAVTSLQIATASACSRRARSLSPSLACTSSPSSLSLSLSPLKPLKAQGFGGPRNAFSRRPLGARAVASPPEADPKAEQLEQLLKSSPGPSAASKLAKSEPAGIDSHAAAAPADAPKYTVWGSDVVASPKRPYFLNREWTSKDIQYAVYMLVVHGLCLAAPFTFSWSAFGVFVLMYIVTGASAPLHLWRTSSREGWHL